MDINTCMHIYKYIYRRTRGHLHFHIYIHCMQSIYTYLYKQKGHIILYTLYKQTPTCIQDIWPNFDLIFDQVRFPWKKGNSRNLSTFWGPRSCEVAIHTIIRIYPQLAWQWKIETMNELMYLILKMVMFQPAMLVFRGVYEKKIFI